MHVEYSLLHVWWPVWLYTYYVTVLQNCSFEWWGYSLLSTEHVSLHYF